MLPVSLYDEIEIRKAKAKAKSAGARIKISCADPLVPRGEQNIVFGAARLLLPRLDERLRIHIHIRKRIPVGAGLGGGSTDAAATLVGLNRLFKLGLSDAHLEKLALSLGADVPFFIRSRPARALGIGERLFRLAGLPRYGSSSSIPAFQFRLLGCTKTSPQS